MKEDNSVAIERSNVSAEDVNSDEQSVILGILDSNTVLCSLLLLSSTMVVLGAFKSTPCA
jgi:hypothetical protein